MPAKEMQLVGDRVLERRSDVDVEVADRVGPHLRAAGRAPGGILRRLDGRDRVAVGDLDQDRAR